MLVRVTREVPQLVVEEVFLWVVEVLVRGIVSGFLRLSESSGKTSNTLSNSFLNSFSIRLSLWTTLKEKCGGGDEAFSSARVLSVLNKEEIQEQIGGHMILRMDLKDGFEGIDVNNFGFVEEISGVSRS